MMMLSYTTDSSKLWCKSSVSQPSCHCHPGGWHELPTIGAICLHVAVPLPSVSSAGSGGEASWQSNKPLLFTQMAGEMAHPTPGNTVPQSWDQHELCCSAPWMKAQTRYAVSSSQLHSPHRISSDCDCEQSMTLWGFVSSVCFCVCRLAWSVETQSTVCFWSGILSGAHSPTRMGFSYIQSSVSFNLCFQSVTLL